MKTREELFEEFIILGVLVQDLSRVIQNPIENLTREDIKKWNEHSLEVCNSLNLLRVETKRLLSGD